MRCEQVVDVEEEASGAVVLHGSDDGAEDQIESVVPEPTGIVVIAWKSTVGTGVAWL